MGLWGCLYYEICLNVVKSSVIKVLYFISAETGVNVAWQIRPKYFSYAIDKIKSVQRKFTKRLKRCKYMYYPTRLTFLNLPRLQRRRLTAGLILTYKIIFWIIRYQDGRLFSTTVYQRWQQCNSRHPFKLFVNYCQTNVRKKFFSKRVVNI